eukprot:jgi/Botrbrau1/23002/Bobra.0030s0066.1
MQLWHWCLHAKNVSFRNVYKGPRCREHRIGLLFRVKCGALWTAAFPQSPL